MKKNYVNEYDSIVKKHFDDITSKKVKPLTRAEERDLSAKWRINGDYAARDKLIVANLPYVINVAQYYRGRGLPYSDLIAEGNIGLIKAMDKFDGERGNKLITYASPWIKQSIQEALSKRNSLDGEELPIEMKDISFDDDDIDLDDECVDLHVNFVESEDIEDHMDEIDNRQLLSEVMDVLNDREHSIISMYYGINGYEPMTLTEIGEKFGLTKERVRQVVDISMKKLRANALERSAQ